MDVLRSANHPVDNLFNLQVHNQVDEIDLRRLVYLGRMVLPAQAVSIDKNPFWNSILAKFRVKKGKPSSLRFGREKENQIFCITPCAC